MPKGTWTGIPVPSAWQNHGYDRQQYTNIRYPFPFDPPYTCWDNPCGVYPRRYGDHPDGLDRFLYFEGVDSCLYVWLNGVFIGYSQVSHSPSEFDITAATEDGVNTLAVLVVKWCDGSYLEDQDKLADVRHFPSGVCSSAAPRPGCRITALPPSLTRRCKPPRCGYGCKKQSPACRFAAPCCRRKAARSAVGVIQGEETAFTLRQPVLWNAEQPRQYRLLLETEEETLLQPVGIRRVEIRNGVLTINRTAVKFRGVNRHDSDPVTGCAVTREQALADLALDESA